MECFARGMEVMPKNQTGSWVSIHLHTRLSLPILKLMKEAMVYGSAKQSGMRNTALGFASPSLAITALISWCGSTLWDAREGEIYPFG